MRATQGGWLSLVVLAPLQGCVTEKLWEGWSEPHGTTFTSSPRAIPQEVVEAVRAGDGSHHLLVRMSDGMENRYVIDGVARAPEGDAATIGSHQWPGTTVDGAALPVPRPDVCGAPIGLPLAVATPRAPRSWSQARRQTPDAAMAVLVDARPDTTPDDPVVRLDGRKVVLTDGEGQVAVLGEFSPPPPVRRCPHPPRKGHATRVVETGARVVMTPFAVTLDVALGAGIVAGCALLLPFMWFTAPMLFR